MGILDGMPTVEDYTKLAEKMAPQFEAFLASEEVTPKLRSVFEQMGEGLSAGDIMGLEKKHRDAMLQVGLNLMRAGENKKAKDFLMMLNLIEPMDTRACYALGVILQQEGDFANAGKLFVNFLAMDATNPDGYLRVGECHLGGGEIKEAIEVFEIARGLAQKGHAPADRIAHANKMIDLAKSRLGNSN